MSKLSKAANSLREEKVLRLDETVVNFMGGQSYVINPLDTLKMVTASSIFGEPSYYRDSKRGGKYVTNEYVSDTILGSKYDDLDTETIMEKVIDTALDYDFGATLAWAATLRRDFNMRLNPQVIMVRAANHPGRNQFTHDNPGEFNRINDLVMSRTDEPMSQMAYYMYTHDGDKKGIPSLLKRSWAKNISKRDRFSVAKYKNHEIGLINAVRICHANSPVIDELMTTGTVSVDENEKTWENLKSAGKGWKEIFETVKMGHMALLRNLRGVFEEVDDLEFCKKYLETLKNGVIGGKQFPFRYYSAYQAVKASNCNHKSVILDALEECIDISVKTLPKLPGKTMCLSDNSGSAWGGFTSEFGTNTVAVIDNLSSVIAGAVSDEGYVGKFGDTIITYPVSKRNGILSQADVISKKKDSDVGGGTEGGIWEFFKKAIDNKEHYDNIFIYSDQQAGHGGLYGTYDHKREYMKAGYIAQHSFINVFKLIQDYRRLVNPKVNVFSIQTAGYNNVVIPEMAYRTAILYGWTGKEVQFAAEYIRQWDEIENRNQ